MKLLENTFEGKGEVKGVTFTKLFENEKGFIYSRSDGYFEAFLRKINKRFDCISYPKSASFGLWAWCCNSEQQAMNYLA